MIQCIMRLLAASLLLSITACTIERVPDLYTEATLQTPETGAGSTPTLRSGLATSTPASEVAFADATSLADVPEPTRTPTAEPLPTSTPVPDLTSAERLVLAQTLIRNENYADAAVEFRESLADQELDEDSRIEALIGLGRAYLQLGEADRAGEWLRQSLALEGGNLSDRARLESATGDALFETAHAGTGYYFLAESLRQQGQCGEAISAYESYLDLNPQLTAYIAPEIATCYQNSGDEEAALQALVRAAEGDAVTSYRVEQVRNLADTYYDAERYQDAVENYDLLVSLDYSDDVSAHAFYRSGWAQILAGNEISGYLRLELAVTSHPTSYNSYRALTDLLDAGRAVDDYQRGMVDYYAKAYDPAVLAFNRYISQTEDHNEEAHLYLAWSYEALGQLDQALAQVEAYISVYANSETAADAPNFDSNDAKAATGQIEKAKMLARSGNRVEALNAYEEYVERYPAGADGPFAAWWSAQLTEWQGEIEEAAEKYLSLVDQYPDHKDASEAMFRAGYLLFGNGQSDEAFTVWNNAAEKYPYSDYGAASVVWLLNNVPDAENEAVTDRAAALFGMGYYQVRAKDIISNRTPFEPPQSIDLQGSVEEREMAENWLKFQFGLEQELDLSQPVATLANDGRLVRGVKLWQLGRFEQGKQELENLRISYQTDALVSYQLSLILSELGLYRSSILGAMNVLRLANISAFDAPTFIARLAFPVHYQELVVEEAQKYGYDPLLQFALIRQESLFESFATSSAVAQGLSQVIPSTGAYIAQKLDWPAFENEDLYKPYVGIAFGAYYIDEQLDRFDGDIALALAAYNGGPGNAARWEGEAPESLDELVEIIDFSETRQYVMRIYAGHAVYRHLYGVVSTEIEQQDES